MHFCQREKLQDNVNFYFSNNSSTPESEEKKENTSAAKDQVRGDKRTSANGADPNGDFIKTLVCC